MGPGAVSITRILFMTEQSSEVGVNIIEQLELSIEPDIYSFVTGAL
jgi:hypothetical protein